MPKNEYELYFQILDELSKNSFVKNKDLTGTLLGFFFDSKQYPLRTDIHFLKASRETKELMILFVTKMQEAGHLVYNASNQELPNTPVNFSKGIFNIYASITPDGFIFFNNERIRRSNLRSFNIQVILAILTTIFIGISTIFTVLNNKEHINVSSNKQAPQQLKKRVQSQQSKKDSIPYLKNHTP